MPYDTRRRRLVAKSPATKVSSNAPVAGSETGVGPLVTLTLVVFNAVISINPVLSEFEKLDDKVSIVNPPVPMFIA